MEWTVTAPAGELGAAVALTDGRLTYQLKRGVAAIVAGDLGLALDAGGLTDDLAFRGARTISVTSAFSLPHGKARQAEAQANELTVAFENGDGHEMDVVIRAYDDGIAFRYRLPDGEDRRTVTREGTTIGFPGGGKAWIQKTDLAGEFTPAYESLYSNGVPIGHSAPVPSWNLPALFEAGSDWVLLAESDLDSSYFGGHIEPDDGTYRWVMPQPREGMSVGDPQPSHAGSWTMPWRVFVIGGLDTVIESNLVRLLARHDRPDADWIRPGKVSWSWWSDHDSPKNLDALRVYIEYGVEAGWEHTLIDANWNLNDEAALRDLIDYANGQGVGVFLWYNSGGPNNEVTEQPRDAMFDPEVRKAELAKLAEWGVAGIKVDFWHSDKQESVGRYLALAADAYDAGLMVNYHGSTIPRGWEVAYPNIMTMEGVRGAEQYSFDADFPSAAPWLNTILPFTRNAVGSMDYTPVTFSDNVFPHVTTNAHELALAVVFESGLQHFADSTVTYRLQAPAVREYLRDVPVVWDETRFVEGYPGEYVVIARRHGDGWWISGINGTDRPMTVTLDLDFVGGATGTGFFDSGPRRIATTPVEAPGMEVMMDAYGGFSLRFP